MKYLLPAFAAAALLFAATTASAQLNGQNFADRKPVLINNAAEYVTLSDFTFVNAYRDRNTRFLTNLKWTNTGSKAITAFEVVMLFYDPFNRPLRSPSGRWLIPGHDSADWSPLAPGETASDGTIGLRDEDAFTGAVYVRAIRFEDGTVWYSTQSEVERDLTVAIPQLRETGDIDPGSRPVP